MALEKVLVPVDLTGGLDTKGDPFLTSGLLEVSNGTYTIGSRITKRKGYTEIERKPFGGGSTLSFDGITDFQEELLAFGGSRLYSYSSGQRLWSDRGGYVNVSTAQDDVVRQNKDVVNSDSVEAAGLILYAWEQQDTAGTSEGIYYSVFDAESNSSLASRVLVSATGTLPRCIQLGNKLALLYVETSSGSILTITIIDSGDPATLQTPTALATDINASTNLFDARAYNTNPGGYAVIAYDTTTANTIKVAYLTNEGTIGTAATGYANAYTFTATAVNLLSLAVDNRTTTTHAATGQIFVAHAENTSGSPGLRITRLNESLTSDNTHVVESTSTEVDNCEMIVDDDGLLQIVYSFHAAATYNHRLRKNTFTVSSSTMGSASALRRSLGMVSRLFIYDGVVYLMAVHDSTLQPTYFVLDTTGLIVAKAAPGTAGELPESNLMASVIEKSSGIFQIATQIRTRLESRDNDLYSLKGLARFTFDFTNPTQFENAELGGNLHIAGGIVQMYDSSNVVEHGFHVYPENVTGVVSGSGGGSTSGTFSWRVIYVWTDEHGQIHRSAPSVALSKTLSSNNYVTLTIPTLRLTAKTNVLIEVYRTTDAGTLYYKVGSVANNQSADSVTFIDGNASSGVAWISATNLVAKQSLYTNGGIVENIPAPPTNVLVPFGQRLWAVSSEDPTKIIYSKRRQPKSAVEFTDVFQVLIPQAREITGLAELDEKLIIFERDAIYYITGAGPTDTGDQNDISVPRLITGDVGCSNTSSIVLMPLGLMFQSAKGIYLLNRSLETVYIGAPVEDYNSLTVTSAELIDDENQIRFLTSDGACLVYDYYFGKWSTFSNHSGSAAVIWKANNKYIYLRTDGRLFEQSSAYVDGNAPYSMSITTGHIKMNGVQGLQRVRRAFVLGSFGSDHIMRVRVGYDYQNYFNEEHTFDFMSALNVQEFGDEDPYGSTVYGGESDGVYQFRMHLAKQKCQSVRFKIEDVQSIGESYSISSLMLESGMKSSGAKLQSAKLV